MVVVFEIRRKSGKKITLAVISFFVRSFVHMFIIGKSRYALSLDLIRNAVD